MDFSDCFFHESFRADGATVSNVKAKPGSAISELVPSGISSSFEPFEWPESLQAIGKDDVLDKALNLTATFEPGTYQSPTFFLDESEPTLDAEALTAQASFSFELDLDTAGIDGKSTIGSLAEEWVDSPAGLPASPAPSSGAAALSRKSASDFKSPQEHKAYRVRRERNNEASRRSRIKFRQRAREMEVEVHDLRQENSDLKKKLNALAESFEALRQSVSGIPGTSPSDTAV